MKNKASCCIRGIARYTTVMVLLCNASLSYGFHDVQELQQFTSKYEEYPQPDNADLLKPDYASFYTSTLPSWIRSLAQFIGIAKASPWNAQQFKNAIEYIVQAREKNGYYGRFVEKITPSPHAQFVIFGDLHGSLHSLMRDIEELVRQGIMDTKFNIIRANTYLVFNGNVIDLSPYVLETLTLVIDLMRANPNTVFYVRGKHEDKEFWHNFGLRQELETKASGLSEEKIPLNALAKQFFNTLPLALYLVQKNGSSINAVRISPADRKNLELNENEFGDFFLQEDKNPDILNLENKAPSKKPVDIRAIIKVEERLATYSVSKGLLNIAPDQGATAWVTLSSPNRTNRTLYEFFYDAFVIIITAPQMQDWTINLYNRDVRDVLGFTRTATYNLITGQKIVPTPYDVQAADSQKNFLSIKQEKEALAKALEECKVQSVPETINQPSPQPTTPTAIATSEITVGTTLDLSRELREIGQSVQKGLAKAIEEVNKEGGINGKTIRLVILDDESNSTLAHQNVEKLMSQYGTDIIIAPIGASATVELLDLVKDKKIVLLFPSSGSSELRDQKLTNIIHFGPSSADIYKNLLQYAMEKLFIKKVAFFAIKNPSTADLQEYFKSPEAAANQNLKLFLHAPHTTDFKSLIKEIIEFGPDAIGLFTAARSASDFIKQMGAYNLTGKKLFGIRGDDKLFRNTLASEGLEKQLIDGKNFPNPLTSNLEIVQEYRKGTESTDLSIFGLEGYISGKLFADLARRVQGPITKESIIQAAESTKNYPFKGLPLTFDPEKRQLHHRVWIDTGNDDWIALDTTPTPTSSPVTTQQSSPAALSDAVTTNVLISEGVRELQADLSL